MELKTWKQLPDDDFTCIEVPSAKMVTIMELNGGRSIGTVSGKDLFYWIVAMPDDKMNTTFAVIRDLRIKGMKFDGVDDETEK